MTGSAEVIGHVTCVDLDAAGNLVNAYIWQFWLSETFDGFWVSPTTYRQYPMKGFRVSSKTANPRMATAAIPVTDADQLTAEKPELEARAVSPSPLSAVGLDIVMRTAEQIRQRLLAAR